MIAESPVYIKFSNGFQTKQPGEIGNRTGERIGIGDISFITLGIIVPK